MIPFTCEKARTPAEAAIAVACDPGAKFITGGTDLLDLMKLQIEQPTHLVEVNPLLLDEIETTSAGGLRTGALVGNARRAAACTAGVRVSRPDVRSSRVRTAKPSWALMCLLVAAGVMVSSVLQAQPPDAALRRDARMGGQAPIPAAEREIPTVTAGSWIRVSSRGATLEGATFDGEGRLLLCNVTDGQILNVTPERQVSVVLSQPKLHVGGLAFDGDGRLHTASAGDLKQGSLGVVVPGKATVDTIVGSDQGYVPNDLVFDRTNGLYFTDFKGSAVEPTGGVYYIAPGGRTVTPVVKGLALANGIALSPDEKFLWITEYGRNRLLRVELESPGSVARLGLTVAYHFIGPAPDSMRTDTLGNLYVALNGQGRVLILSPGGVPIGQILLPGRDEGHNLKTTSLALKPGSNEVYILSSDGNKGMGSSVFVAHTFFDALGQEVPHGR